MDMFMEICYKKLGVPINASLEEIKSAYRKILKELHPDLTNSEDPFYKEKTIKLREYYEYICKNYKNIEKQHEHSDEILSESLKKNIIIQIKNKQEEIKKLNNSILTENLNIGFYNEFISGGETFWQSSVYYSKLNIQENKQKIKKLEIEIKNLEKKLKF